MGARGQRAMAAKTKRQIGAAVRVRTRDGPPPQATSAPPSLITVRKLTAGNRNLGGGAAACTSKSSTISSNAPADLAARVVGHYRQHRRHTPHRRQRRCLLVCSTRKVSASNTGDPQVRVVPSSRFDGDQWRTRVRGMRSVRGLRVCWEFLRTPMTRPSAPAAPSPSTRVPAPRSV